MKSIQLFIVGLLAAVCLTALGEETLVHPQLKAFPLPEKGIVRHVIALPYIKCCKASDFKVEIVAGKTMETDGTNLYALGSNLEAKPLKGWGYTFYTVNAGPTMSTMMAPPPGAPKVEAFVTGQPLLLDYNHRLPIVVYAPESYEVQYRIFKAQSERTAATPN